ncbi:probable membrane-associated kinase regulator 1 [Camellia sinensis]|uniref:probable membrane-associated kinase regulator 1 n=1 Tax=Camellia sinensis TaxID=4442 RepID=UPI001036A56B|nr:probable membrane-associated kinase regulator 1 [Camellia sinensis]
MGRRTLKSPKSYTLPSSPTHSLSSSSSSASDFEFSISLSPLKSSSTTTTTTTLCPADDLFYRGQLLPLHLSPRLSMVRSLLLSSTTTSRDSTASSSSSSFSSRPSSATDDDLNRHHHTKIKKPKKPFSLSRFSSVFRKESNPNNPSGSSVKRLSSTAKEVIFKYLNKVKPLYEKMGVKLRTTHDRSMNCRDVSLIQNNNNNNNGGGFSNSFSRNLRYPRRRNCVSSCPSSMRSSPTHSGVLIGSGFLNSSGISGVGCGDSSSSTMEELQSAIQGAIAHCKNSMVQNKISMVSNES